MAKFWQLSRRTMLRAVGAAVTLPWLEAMQPLSAIAVTPKRPKLRAGYLYFPNGVAKGSWEPDKVERDGKLRRLNKWMKDLEPFKKDILVGHNIWTPRGNGHGAGTATWLTGGSYSGSRVSAGGASVDQIIAKYVGGDTMLPSLELSMRGEGYFSNSLPRNSISWVKAKLPATRDTNPRTVYDRMFRKSSEGVTDKGVIDLVNDQAKSLKRRVGQVDQQKIDEYMEALRAVERRMEFAEKQIDKSALAQTEGVQFKRPSVGIPDDHETYMRTMMDLMVLGFWSGATRVGSLMLDHGQSNRYFDFIDGLRGTWHALSHYRDISGKTEDDDGINSWKTVSEKRDMYNAVTAWHHRQFAYMLRKMKSIDEGNGTLLDNTMLLYGSSLGDGHAHGEENLPVIFAGGGGGTVRSGRYLKYRRNYSLSKYHLATMQRMGVPVEEFAEVDNLGNPVTTYHDVLRTDVAMHDVE